MTPVQKAWKRSGLQKRELAKALGRSFYTVYAWLRNPESDAFRPICDDDLAKIKRLTKR